MNIVNGYRMINHIDIKGPWCTRRLRLRLAFEWEMIPVAVQPAGISPLPYLADWSLILINYLQPQMKDWFLVIP